MELTFTLWSFRFYFLAKLDFKYNLSQLIKVIELKRSTVFSLGIVSVDIGEWGDGKGGGEG